MAKRNKTPKEGLGVVTSAPEGPGAKGYGFVETDDGDTVYCPKDVVKSAQMKGHDVGSKCRVRYVLVNSRYVAIRVNVLREPDGSDQDIADAFARIDVHISNIDDEMDTIYNILEERGCRLPVSDVEDDTSQTS